LNGAMGYCGQVSLFLIQFTVFGHFDASNNCWMVVNLTNIFLTYELIILDGS